MLALRGATVVLAVRNTEAGEQSKARILEELKAAMAAESAEGSTSEAVPSERLIVLRPCAPLRKSSKASACRCTCSCG